MHLAKASYMKTLYYMDSTARASPRVKSISQVVVAHTVNHPFLGLNQQHIGYQPVLLTTKPDHHSSQTSRALVKFKVDRNQALEWDSPLRHLLHWFPKMPQCVHPPPPQLQLSACHFGCRWVWQPERTQVYWLVEMAGTLHHIYMPSPCSSVGRKDTPHSEGS